MWNAIPVVGWLMSIVLGVSIAIPFWYIWTYCELGRRYFYFLPDVYQSIPFWDTVGLFIITWILRSLVPKLMTAESKAESKQKGG